MTKQKINNKIEKKQKTTGKCDKALFHATIHLYDTPANQTNRFLETNSNIRKIANSKHKNKTKMKTNETNKQI